MAIPFHSDQRLSKWDNIIGPSVTGESNWPTPGPPVLTMKHFTQAWICLCGVDCIEVKDDRTCNLPSQRFLFIVFKIFEVFRKLQDHLTVVIHKLRGPSL